jgi:hypothetical protein
MKIRDGFVSNSSSSSFCVENKTNQDKRLSDFIRENENLIAHFNHSFRETHEPVTLQDMLDSIDEDTKIPANQSVGLEFESYAQTYGMVLRFSLAASGNTESFEWWHLYDF